MLKIFTVFLLIISLMIVRDNFGQASPGSIESIKLDDLKAPSSPSFVLLDLQPASISRPQTIKDVETSMLSTLDENGFLQRNIAIELNPYSIASEKVISYQEFIEKKKPFQNLIQNFAISLATTENDSLLEGTVAGLGFHTVLFDGEIDKNSHSKMIKILNNQNAINAVITPLVSTSFETKESLVEELKDRFSALKSDEELDKNILQAEEDSLVKIINQDTVNTIDSRKEILQNYMNEDLSTRLEDAAKGVENVLKNKYGYFLDIAGALAVQFPTNNWDSRRIPRSGLWLTTGYRFLKPSIDVIGVIRFMQNDIFTDEIISDDNIDVGFKLAYEFDKLSIAGEGLWRFADNVDADDRFVFTVNYQISTNIVLTYAIGKNFDFNLANEGTVISTIGISFGAGLKTLTF